MVTLNSIHALRESVQKVSDGKLKEEILGKLSEVQENMVARQGEFEVMRAHLHSTDAHSAQSSPFVYDPPV